MLYRLLDMGFEQDLSFIQSTIRNQSNKKIQTVLLSATLVQSTEEYNFNFPPYIVNFKMRIKLLKIKTKRHVHVGLGRWSDLLKSC